MNGGDWSTLPENYENHAEFGSGNFSFVPFHVGIQWKRNGTLSDLLISDTIFPT